MAYTKYSLTPANNTATPPDGAPEGMLPSAVNDTMRDMMAQIRDCGDGIRDGTYTMTAPKITGGTITGSTINNSAIGGTTAAAGKFTTLEATGVTTVQAGTVSAPAITTSGDTNTGIFFPAADTIAFTEGGVESMRIDSSGNVGIGTSSPFYTAANRQTTSINGGSGGAMLSFGISGTGKGSLFQDGDNLKVSGYPGYLYFATGNTDAERMRIDSSGNLLVGTTSAAFSSATRGLIELNGSSTSLFAFKKGGSASAYIQSSTNFEILNINNSAMTFGTNDTERMRIDSSGNLLVGTTTTTFSDVGIRARANNSLEVVRSGAETMFLNRLASDGGIVSFNRSGTQVGTISVTTSATAYNTSSDYRLKENIAPMTGALDKVAQLKPVTYTWKVDGSAGQGFIAHELQTVVPDCVTGEKDAIETYTDEDGNEQTRPKYQGVDTSFLVATLTAAIQELKAELDATKAEVQALKGV